MVPSLGLVLVVSVPAGGWVVSVVVSVVPVSVVVVELVEVVEVSCSVTVPGRARFWTVCVSDADVAVYAPALACSASAARSAIALTRGAHMTHRYSVAAAAAGSRRICGAHRTPTGAIAASAAAHRREQLAAGLLAAPALRGAEPAVLVVLGVALALLATGAAGRGTRLDRGTKDGGVGRDLADHHASGGHAHVGAVEAEADAAPHVLHVALGQVRVGTARARRGAVHAGLDAAHHRLAIATGRLRVRIEHLSNRHLRLLGSVENRG
jgi:hypothetical protein